MKRTVKFLLVLTTVFLLVFTSMCFAASTSYDFNTGDGGRAWLSGRDNGVFYSLTDGSHTLSLTNSSGTGTLYITLYKDNSWFGLGQMMGTWTWNVSTGTNDSHNYSVDETRNDYYLFFKGSGSYVSYSGSGTFN